jgi:hypothetical protein
MRYLGPVLPWATHLGVFLGATVSPAIQTAAFLWLAAHVVLMFVSVYGGTEHVTRARWVLKLSFGVRSGPPPRTPPTGSRHSPSP